MILCRVCLGCLGVIVVMLICFAYNVDLGWNLQGLITVDIANPQELAPHCPRTRLEILDFVTERLDKHELQYFVIFGTLLGGVRSQGIIPWTGDVDIAIVDAHLPRQQEFMRELACFAGIPTSRVSTFQPMAKNVERVSFGWQSLFSTSVSLDVYNARTDFDTEKVNATYTEKAVKIPTCGTCNISKDGRFEKVRWDMLFPLQPESVTIEGKLYTGPNNPDDFLTMVYGDWRVEDANKWVGITKLWKVKKK
eukprot:m.17980 g.17980  ORF g.17980 m.17980 type:complete len:251 (+) comp6156_c0_seq2:211-963(+)